MRKGEYTFLFWDIQHVFRASMHMRTIISLQSSSRKACCLE